MKLNDVDVFLPIKKNKLSNMQKNNSLRAMSVAKEKFDGNLKGCACVDGRKQCQWNDKQQAASLTVHAESFMFATATEAKEGR